MSRALRLRSVMRAGAQVAQVASAGLYKAASYGVEVIGMGGSMLKRIRTSAHLAVIKSYRSRSATVDFSLQANPHFDPTYYIRTAPPMWYLTAIWDNLLPRDMLYRTLSTAVFRGGTQPNWNKVIGPASATVASLLSFDWRIDPDNLNLWGPVGHAHLSIDEFCPRDLCVFMQNSIQICLWAHMSQATTTFSDIHGIPWLDPIRKLLFSKNTSDFQTSGI